MTTRVTTYTYDWRGRRVATDGEVDFYQETAYDNLDRPTVTQRRDTTSGGNLVAKSEVKFDARGRVYQTVRYGVDPDTGTVGNALTDNTWYDAASQVIKEQPAGSRQFVKHVYDGLGRKTKSYLGYDLSESSYADASTVTGDTILEQTELTYDAGSNVIQTTVKQRYHNSTGTGELNGPSGVQPKARITYSASWPDALGRPQATAEYGTNGGSALSRPDTIPARSDTVLIVSLDYNNAGQVAIETNPAGISTCFLYDAAGRQIVMIMNCTGSSSSSSSSSSSDSSSGCLASLDENVIVRTSYNADGNVVELIAENSVTGTQATQYVYGTTLSDSGIASSLLKRKEIYPDSVDGDDEIRFTYNRQGEITSIRDQNGTVHAYDYDLLARQIHDRVTTLGTGVDGTVRRISTSYEVRGMREKITSWNGETVGSGSVVNEVQFAYNEFGQPIDDYQAHSSTVNTSTTPKVQYAYADGSANTIRPTSITYPNGRAIHYGYGSSNSMADVLSRVGAIIDSDGGSTHLADYSYLGLRTFVEVDYTEPNVKYTLVGTAGGNDPDTGDIYRGLDRFGRIKDSYWYNYGSPADVDRIKYGYDRNGNRTYRENTVATSYGKYFDELYQHDRLDRLKHMERGRLTDEKDGITNQTFAQCWSLDETGNWKKFLEDSDGDGVWDLNQFRSANTVNEITDVSEIAGPSWATPAYNRAGNMTTIPKPADPTQSFTGTYDAWNRLVKLEDGSGTVAQYEYDGAKRRTVTKTYTSGTLSETQHFYYTEPSRWQVVEERVESSSDAERQFIWGLRYVDDIVLRDRDTDDDASLDERLYGLQDANWNVTSQTASTGLIRARSTPTPFGVLNALDSSFEVTPPPPLATLRLFAGAILDDESSLYPERHRRYHATFGAWTQRDMLGYVDGPSLMRAYFLPESTDPYGLAATKDVCRILVVGGHGADVTETGGVYNEGRGGSAWLYLREVLQTSEIKESIEYVGVSSCYSKGVMKNLGLEGRAIPGGSYFDNMRLDTDVVPAWMKMIDLALDLGRMLCEEDKCKKVLLVTKCDRDLLRWLGKNNGANYTKYCMKATHSLNCAKANAGWKEISRTEPTKQDWDKKR